MWRRVFQKEFLEMRRDKRAFSSALIMPFLLVWMFVVLFGVMQKSVRDPKDMTFHIVKSATPNPIVEQLKKQDKIKIVDCETLAAGEKLIKDGDAKLVLKFDDAFTDKLKSNAGATVVAVYDKSEVKSSLALGVFQDLVSAMNRSAIEVTLQAKGLPKSAAEPIKVVEREVEIKEALGSSIILSMIPYLVVLYAFYGGFSIVGDMVAGEKEKLTLETLLIAPISRKDIALGKFTALALLCISSSLMTLLSVFVAGSLRLPLTKGLFPNGVSISIPALAGVLAALVPLVALFAATMLAVSAYARNIREAQTYLTMVSFIVLMPAIFSQFIGFTSFANAKWLAAVPILNTSTAIRDALLGKADFGFIAMAAAVNVVLAAIALLSAIRMFSREQVLLRI